MPSACAWRVAGFPEFVSALGILHFFGHASLTVMLQVRSSLPCWERAGLPGECPVLGNGPPRLPRSAGPIGARGSCARLSSESGRD